ncbi:Site-specific recombinase XerD [Bradyrhizobium shewense]|uniref:Site-specific recombinase XerD n=1 Tax=Bradyrhizobium shewense TaxID=1761772 RepID=A0A1C3X845_9BRAD|nr:integrase family protein [Bradyrhizobium shewense]SCB48417.1 Site-specific recombinase XerD [Bradyrhizobium shewense]
MPKLTKRFVDSLEAKDTDYFAWDEELPGFGVRTWISGRKTYVAQYRKAGRSRRVKIGAHGALTVEEARKEARVILGDVARGEDPAEDRATRRKSITVRELCDNYIAAAEAGLIMGKRNLPKKPSTLASDRGRIEQHIKPLLGYKLVRDLTLADVNRFIKDVTVGKTARIAKSDKKRGKSVVEGGAGTAARTAGLLGGILTFAVHEGIRPDNPARGAKRQADGSRNRRLTPQEYRLVGKALKAARDDADVVQGLHGIWLLAPTGCRLGEVEALKWTETDAQAGCFRLADSKEGASVRPIGKAVFDMLAKIERRKDCPYVLPAARSAGRYGGMARAMDRIMTRAGLDDVSAHTFRHSYASVAGDLGYSDSTIETLLGHTAGNVTSKYIHRLDSVLIAAADNVARTIHGFMTRESLSTKAAGAR